MTYCPKDSFKKELEIIDKNLYAKWNIKLEKWEIRHIDARGKHYLVMRVQYPNGSFKPLDNRTLVSLKASNKFRCLRPQEIMYHIDKVDAEKERQKQKNFSNEIEAISKDNFNYIVGIKPYPVPNMETIK